MPAKRSARKRLAKGEPSGRKTTARARNRPAAAAGIPTGQQSVALTVGSRPITLTNLAKPFWPKQGITKGDLLRYYAAIAPVLLPHLAGRAMVMKRYPDGAPGKMFFMKRTPEPHPAWLHQCAIEHGSGSIIDFPVIDDLAALLWVINLGCIDLNPWYARCDDVDRPDFLYFDLDPGPGVPFAKVREAALLVRDALETDGLPSYAKTTGSHGIHVAVPIIRGPVQKAVWTYAKALSLKLAGQSPRLLTAVYRVAGRPPGHVLVDYNQNAWGRTLASVYSVRPTPTATVSTPVTWREIEQGVDMNDFRLDTVPARVKRLGDLWAPMLARRGRVALPAGAIIKSDPHHRGWAPAERARTARTR
jgi:bifunctional non-homologous end joining protein LigD